MAKVISSNPIEGFYDRWVPARQLAIVDHLIDLKHKNQTDVWVVIDAVIDTWKKKNPTEYKSFIIETEHTRKTRVNEFGANKKASLRYTVDCPEFVCKALRFLYDPEELVMGKEFWAIFWRRYPIFRVSEKS